MKLFLFVVMQKIPSQMVRFRYGFECKLDPVHSITQSMVEFRPGFPKYTHKVKIRLQLITISHSIFSIRFYM
jgi:hypothetical protein